MRHQQKKPSEVSGALPAHVCGPNLSAAAAAAAVVYSAGLFARLPSVYQP